MKIFLSDDDAKKIISISQTLDVPYEFALDQCKMYNVSINWMYEFVKTYARFPSVGETKYSNEVLRLALTTPFDHSELQQALIKLKERRHISKLTLWQRFKIWLFKNSRKTIAKLTSLTILPIKQK